MVIHVSKLADSCDSLFAQPAEGDKHLAALTVISDIKLSCVSLCDSTHLEIAKSIQYVVTSKKSEISSFCFSHD